ncbi:MAG: FlgD immunoglobulin-like domain containing protein [Ignavibacteria bacterium]
MKKFLSGLFFVILISLTIGSQFTFAQEVIFEENFESGKVSSQWETYYAAEDSLQAVPATQAPQVLTGGGSYVGYLQDLNSSYTGSAVAVAGDLGLKDYSIEADVYVYVNQPLSAYTGLVVYADSSKHDFYKLRADFDASNRINFSGLKSDTTTFIPLFNKNFSGTSNLGLFPTADGWHKLKIEVRSTSDTQTTIWNYFDGVLLNGNPVIDTIPTRVTSGKFGLYSFQQDTDGLPAYFDNIVVKRLAPAGVSGNKNSPKGFILEQNYPNPFNPETRISYQLASGGFVVLAIFDQLGREIKTLVSREQSAGQYSVSWNGKNETGNIVPTGVYFYALKSGDNTQIKKMILMK